MSTAITDFYASLRHVLGDTDSSVQRYENSALLVGVQTVIKCGKIEDYALTEDCLSITPSVTDPNDWALVLYYTAHSFVSSRPDTFSFRTRAMSQSWHGATNNFLRAIEENIYDLKNGDMFDSWQSLDAWLIGVSGLNLAYKLTRLSSVDMLEDQTIPVS